MSSSSVTGVLSSLEAINLPFLMSLMTTLSFFSIPIRLSPFISVCLVFLCIHNFAVFFFSLVSVFSSTRSYKFPFSLYGYYFQASVNGEEKKAVENVHKYVSKHALNIFLIFKVCLLCFFSSLFLSLYFDFFPYMTLVPHFNSVVCVCICVYV
jgi:hypothetical protein